MTWNLSARCEERKYTDLEARVVYRQGYNDGFSNKPKESTFADYYTAAYDAGYEDGKHDATS